MCPGADAFSRADLIQSFHISTCKQQAYCIYIDATYFHLEQLGDA